MITTIDILSSLYDCITAASIPIDGNVYKTLRPSDRQNEDIVINSLPLSGSQTQRCTLNVNCYVPDVFGLISEQEQFMPNLPRLNEIGTAIMALLENEVLADGICWIEMSGVYQEEKINQHYFNVRLQYHGH